MFHSSCVTVFELPALIIPSSSEVMLCSVTEDQVSAALFDSLNNTAHWHILHMHLNNAVWVVLFNAICFHRFSESLSAMHQPHPVQIHYQADQSKAKFCVQGAWVSPGLVTVLLTGHSPVRLSWAEQSLTLLCTHRGQETLKACPHWSEVTSLQGTGDSGNQEQS